MPSGKVKWFNSKKGYGFITEDKTEKDIFLHVSALEESKLRILKEDQKLEFELHLIKLDCDDSWVEQTILEAVSLLSSDIFPEASSNCDNCNYLRARWNASKQ